MSGRGTRTAKMLEYERQAQERMREVEIMNEERNRMVEELIKIQQEQDRIAQEEYEIAQYYEAEALRHAEEVRIHREGEFANFSSLQLRLHYPDKISEVRRHQERIREHEARLRDHEATAEAFAKIVAMPVPQTRDRQVSFQASVGARLAGKGTPGQGQGG